MATARPEAGTTLRIQKAIAAPVAKVFEAWTRPEFMKRWMGPSDDFTVPEASADPRVGGSYRIVMRHRDGSEHVAFGTYEEVTPPTKLVFTWSWESPNSTKDTLVTVELEARGETTLLKLTHERFPNVEARDNHQKGWTGTLDRLEAALR